MTYEYAILSLVELESQKKKINNIATINNNICENISISSQIIASFNSLIKTIKLKINYNHVSDIIETCTHETIIEPTLGNIIDINKKIKNELEEQNHNLNNLDTVIQQNNYNITKNNNNLRPLLDG